MRSPAQPRTPAPPCRPARSRRRPGRSWPARQQVAAIRRALGDLVERHPADQHVVDGRRARAVVDAERGAGVALRVEVDHQHAQPVQREGGRDVHRGRGLADPALLVGHRDHATPARARHPVVLGVEHPSGAGGLLGDRGHAPAVAVDDLARPQHAGTHPGHGLADGLAHPLRAHPLPTSRFTWNAVLSFGHKDRSFLPRPRRPAPGPEPPVSFLARRSVRCTTTMCVVVSLPRRSARPPPRRPPQRGGRSRRVAPRRARSRP